ncbi:MAG TPA: hypothetical protein VE713_04805 [Pyrinomonadaceae bacterium]|nr:hypothetical protein [Pyrinomonadaceae bacterium]
MKRLLLGALWVLIVSCVNFMAVHAQDDPEVRKELEAQYKKLAEAHDRQDLKTIVGLKTADFHAIFPEGRVLREVTRHGGAQARQPARVCEAQSGLAQLARGDKATLKRWGELWLKELDATRPSNEDERTALDVARVDAASLLDEPERVIPRSPRPSV